MNWYYLGKDGELNVFLEAGSPQEAMERAKQLNINCTMVKEVPTVGDKRPDVVEYLNKEEK